MIFIVFEKRLFYMESRMCFNLNKFDELNYSDWSLYLIYCCIFFCCRVNKKRLLCSNGREWEVLPFSKAKRERKHKIKRREQILSIKNSECEISTLLKKNHWIFIHKNCISNTKKTHPIDFECINIAYCNVML